MNVTLFIARRILFSQSKSRRISKPITWFNILGIAISFVVMFISIAVVMGFKQEIKYKVSGFSSHLVVSNYDANYSFETNPIYINKNDIEAIRHISTVKNVQLFATKPGIIKVGNILHGAVLKGVYKDFDWSFLRSHIVTGKVPTFADSTKSNEVLISKKISNILAVKPGDALYVYFIQDPPRMRKFIVSGIYETMMEDFDNMFVFVDLRHIQKLNDWQPNQVSGYEINLKHFDSIPAARQMIYSLVGAKFQNDGTKLKVSSIQERYPYIFDWIGLFDTNLWVILILMMIVSGFNIISGLLVLVLERVNMIGLLKTMGFYDSNIRKIFIYLSSAYILFGLLLGNILAYVAYYLQKTYHVVSLNKASYYIDYVPVQIEWWQVVLLNSAIVVITFIILLVPSSLISRIEPIKAIKFD
ncbi:MAG: ABC transporter permease [Bacteroidales bacterium]|nr:ABC transporter permease [Bacteroidales bacterium]